MTNRQLPLRAPLWSMVSILLLAAAFRFLAADAAPPGWRDDELIEFGIDQRIAQGWRPLFIAEAEGHEPVYHYLHAGTIALFGENIVGYKWLPFAFGLLSVALTFALARRLFDVRVALLAAALMAASFWPIMYARLGVRHVGILPLMLGAFYLLFPSLPPSRAKGDSGRPLSFRERLRGEGRILLAGILLAAALMTYFAGRTLPVILVGFLVYLLIFQRSILRQVWLRYVAAIILAALIALPMFIQIANTPGGEKRTEVVGGPLIAASHGDLQPALKTTLGTLGMFTFAGDPESLYNVSGRPVFDWITGIVFYLGVLLCIIRLNRIESGFALGWLLIGIAPAFVSLPAGSFSHTIAAQPVVYILAAYGAVAALDKVTKWQSDRVGWRLTLSPFHLVTLLLVGLNVFLTTRDYFGAWATDPFVRFQYHAPTRDIAQWLDQQPNVTDIAIGTHPNELWLDPVALQLDLKRQDVKPRWFDPAAALVFPEQGVMVLSSMRPASKQVSALLQTAPFERQRSTSSGTTSFELYTFSPLIGGFPPPGGAFDNSALLLLRTQSTQQPAQPGDSLVWQSTWQIVKPGLPSRLKMFLHVLDRQNQVIVGDDREDMNFASLQVGDRLWQINAVTLPADLAPGAYQIEVGWYSPESGERLKTADGSDRFLLDPVEVTAP